MLLFFLWCRLAKPFWDQNQKPADVSADEEKDAVIDCIAHGTPKPTITWGINGVNLKSKLPRRFYFHYWFRFLIDFFNICFKY